MTILEFLQKNSVIYEGSILYKHTDDGDMLVSFNVSYDDKDWDGGLYLRNVSFGFDMILDDGLGSDEAYKIYISDDGIHSGWGEFREVGRGLDKWNEIITKQTNINKLINKI